MGRNGENGTQVCGIAECKKLIPLFNPSVEEGMNSSEWIANVETIKSMFKWTDESTLFYAALRLEEAASSWFTATKHQGLTWTEFKASLLLAFPPSVNDSKVYEQLMKRSKTKEESIEKYFYDVLALARRGGFTDESAKKFIVSGLQDRELVSAVTGSISQANTMTELLAQIKLHLNVIEQQRTRAKFTNKVSQSFNDQASKTYKPYFQTRKPQTESRVCFNCRETGHLARDCRKKKSIRTNYRSNDEYPAKIARLSTAKNNGLVKTVSIDDKNLNAFLDLGSECSTIKISKVNENNWQFEPANNRLVGFGNSSVTALGKLRKTVKVQDVVIPIEIFVVKDSDQDCDMLIGQNFLDSEGVRCVREADIIK